MPVRPATARPTENTAREEERIHCWAACLVEVLAAWNFKGFSLSVWEVESEPFAVAESGLGVAEWALFPAEFPASAELAAGPGRVGKAPASGRGSCVRVREPLSRVALVPPSREFACRREEEACPGLCPEVVDPTAGLRSGLVPGWVFPSLSL